MRHTRSAYPELLIVISLLGACATRPPAVSEDQRLRLGRIAIASAEGSPTVVVDGPVALGGIGGGIAGGAKGLGLGVLFGAGCFVTLGYVPELCIATLATPYWVGRGVVDGAMKAIPESDRQRYLTVVSEAATDTVSEAVVRRLLEEGSRRAAPMLVLEEPDSVAEIALVRLGLVPARTASTANIWTMSVPDVDPTLELVADMRLRVLGAADQRVLLGKTYAHRGERRANLAEWADDDGALFRRELGRAVDALARMVADDLFGAVPERSDSAATPPSVTSDDDLVLP